MNPVVLAENLYRQIEREGAAAYPDECCGIMIGIDEGSRRVVEDLMPVQNEFDDSEKHHRFLISPQKIMKADKDAGARGKLVLGFYHSHPDHPARPSEYDRAHGWPFYSYVIVAIEKRTAAAMTCWVLDEATEQFIEQAIQVVG